jgi:hypothetical protein
MCQGPDPLVHRQMGVRGHDRQFFDPGEDRCQRLLVAAGIDRLRVIARRAVDDAQEWAVRCAHGESVRPKGYARAKALRHFADATSAGSGTPRDHPTRRGARGVP